MANVVITAVPTKTYFKVDFGIYSPYIGYSHLFFWKDDLELVKLGSNDEVLVIMKGIGEPWILSFDGLEGTFTVDTVLTVAPLSNSDLADKIANIKG